MDIVILMAYLYMAISDIHDMKYFRKSQDAPADALVSFIPRISIAMIIAHVSLVCFCLKFLCDYLCNLLLIGAYFPTDAPDVNH